MPKNTWDHILSALKSGAAELDERTGETVGQVADSVSRILDEAGTQGAKIKKTLVRNWTSLERPRRGSSMPIVLGIVALGAAAAYLVSRSGSAASTRG